MFEEARHAFLDGLHSLSILCSLLSPFPCSSLLSYIVKLVGFFFFCLLPRSDCLDKECPWPFLSFSNPGTALRKLSSHFVYKVTNKMSNYPIGKPASSAAQLSIGFIHGCFLKFRDNQIYIFLNNHLFN